MKITSKEEARKLAEAKVCVKCKDPKSPDCFCLDNSSEDKKSNTCKQCVREYDVAYRANNKEKMQEYQKKYYAKNKNRMALVHKKYKQSEQGKAMRRDQDKKLRARDCDKVKARQILSRAVASGKIKKEPCEQCNSIEKIEGHHEDYSKPLDVNWLCKEHHMELHAIKKEATK